MAGDITVWLRKARTDFSSVATVATITGESPSLETADLGTDIRIAATSEHVLGLISWFNEVPIFASLRSGYAGEDDGIDFTGDLGLKFGLPDSGGDAVGTDADNSALRHCDDAANAPSLVRWPSTGVWAFLPPPDVPQVSVSLDGGTAMLYGVKPSTFAQVAIIASSTATGGSPTSSTIIANHPELGAPPRLLFLMI